MEIKKKTWLITGGGSGMGRELTLQMLAMGANVAAVDINEDSLEETVELAGDLKFHLSTHVLDVTDPESIEKLPAAIIEFHGVIDGVINNAGVIQPFIKVMDLKPEQIKRVMDINFFGPLQIIRSFLPHLLAGPEGHIVNISSMGGFLPVPGQTVYGASKAAIKLLSEGLYSELRGTNVHVTTVFPGAIATNITANSGVEIPKLDKGSSSFKPLPASEAAAIIISGIEKNKFRIMVGKDARSMDLLSRFSPRRAADLIADKMKDLLKRN